MNARSSRILRTFAVVASLVAAWPGTALAQRVRTAADTGRISGVVRDSGGRPVAGADITAAGMRASSDSTGAFTLRDLPIGHVLLTIRRLGFHQLIADWEVSAEPLTLDLTLTPAPVTLPAVVVRSRKEPYDSRLAGFNERRAKGLGYYITREQIDAMNTFRLIDALQRIPGVKVKTMSGALGRTITLPGAACPPLVFVDGFPASRGSFDLDMLDLTTVEGVEVYPEGSSVPAEFMGPFGMGACGVIAVWSRPMRPQVRANQLTPEHVNLDSLIAQHTVYLSDAVDEQAKYMEYSASPMYPDSEYRAHVPGRVLARFVVDTAGRVELGSVQIVASTSAAFADAVKQVIGNARFTPAVLGGKPVRSLVDLPFNFDAANPDSVIKRK